MDERTRNLTARVAQSAYIRQKASRQSLVSEYDPEIKLVDRYTDKHHSTFEDANGNIYLGIRGTDFNNQQSGRNEDLVTDLVLTFGLEGITPRFKKSEKLLKKIQEENPDKKIILSGHSLGGRISRDLGYKYNLENHNYAPGSTHMHNQTNFLKYHPEAAKKKAKSHVYITSGGDPISTAAFGDLLSTVHVVPMKKLPKKKRGVLQSHSIYNFIDE
jgi:hypothetical protein